jgi:hypothetical protein
MATTSIVSAVENSTRTSYHEHTESLFRHISEPMDVDVHFDILVAFYDSSSAPGEYYESVQR